MAKRRVGSTPLCMQEGGKGLGSPGTGSVICLRSFVLAGSGRHCRWKSMGVVMTQGCAGTAISRGGVRWVLGAHLGSGSITFAVELPRLVVTWQGMGVEGAGDGDQPR